MSAILIIGCGYLGRRLAARCLAKGGRVVLEAEGVLRSACPEAVVLRFAGIYGPGRLLRERAIRAAEPMTGDPEVWLNLIHVDDGVEALLAAEQKALPGCVYNVCDD